MRYIIVLIVFISSFSQAQEAPTFEPEQEGIEPASATDTDTDTEVSQEIQATEEETAAPINNTEGDPEDFEVFRPSEDISEDLSVPFPSDI